MTDHLVGVASVSTSLQVHGYLRSAEFDELINHWKSLDRHLLRFRPDAVQLHLHIKQRDTPSQHVVLEAKIAGQKPIVARSSSTDLQRALNEVRDELIRQLTDAKEHGDPRHNRRLHQSLRSIERLDEVGDEIAGVLDSD